MATNLCVSYWAINLCVNYLATNLCVNYVAMKYINAALNKGSGTVVYSTSYLVLEF